MLQLWKVTKVNIRDSTSQGQTVPKMNTHPAKGQYKKLLRLLSIFPLNLLFIRCIKLAQNFLVSSPVNRNSNSDVFLFSLNHLKILLYIFLHFSWNLRAVKCFLNGFSSDKSKTDFALAGIFALDKTWVKSSFCQCTQQLFPKWDRMFHFE